jgi:hypothetical protein
VHPAAFVFASLALAGCAVPLTPAELAQYEAHSYPARSKAQVYKATETALKSLGYEIVVGDQAAGKLKTAPKVVAATAYGNSYGAVATESAIAWVVDLAPGDGATTMHAEPRGFYGGQPMPPSQMNGAYMKKLFDNFYAEVNDNLSAK